MKEIDKNGGSSEELQNLTSNDKQEKVESGAL